MTARDTGEWTLVTSRLLLTVGSAWEKVTGCLSCSAGARLAGGWAGRSGASGGTRGCWGALGGRQPQQQGRGRLGEDSRDLTEGPPDLLGTVTGSYSQARAQGTAAAHCSRPSRGSASSTWSAGSGTRS